MVYKAEKIGLVENRQIYHIDVFIVLETFFSDPRIFGFSGPWTRGKWPFRALLKAIKTKAFGSLKLIFMENIFYSFINGAITDIIYNIKLKIYLKYNVI